MTGQSIHACAVDIAGSGVLIEGPAGSGKTSLAFGLVEQARLRGLEAAIVADDRTVLARSGENLVASPAPAIAGLAEIRGHGVVRIDHRPQTVLRLAVRLVDDSEVERMPEQAAATIDGVVLPLVLAPIRHEAGAVRIVLAALGHAGL